MTDLWLDLRQAVRLCRRAPVMAAVIVSSLTLAIGANTAVFSFVNAIQFRPLPVADEQTLVDLSEWSATELCAGCGVGTSYPGFLEWREGARSFSAMSAYKEMSFAVSGGGDPERVGGAVVSAGLFPMLGVHPSVGRGIMAADETPSASPVVLISERLWRNRVGSRTDVIGQTLKVDGRAHTIVGIMPAGFGWPEYAQLWIPLGADASAWPRTDRSLTVVARLAPGTDRRRAEAEMRALAAAQAAANPETNARWTVNVTSLREDMTGETAMASIVFLSAVGFVLLIACANVANLLLVRAVERRREIAVRLALGASRGRIVRLVLTESLAFSAAGGVLGSLVAIAGSRWLVSAFQTEAPYWIQFGIDWHVPVFAVLLTAATSLLCGLAPALQSSKRDVQATLQEGSIGSAAPGGGVRSALVVLQLTLALVLLAGAGLMIKTVARIYQFDAGYDTSRVVVADLSLSSARYDTPQARRAFVADVLGTLTRMPSARAAFSRPIFFAGFGGESRRVVVEGAGEVAPGLSPGFYHAVTPGYFDTLGVRLLQGRAFGGTDVTGVVVINREMAERIWPGRSPLGARIRFGQDAPPLEVIGVIADEGGSPFGTARRTATAYVPFAGNDGRSVALYASSDSAAPLETLGPEIRAAVRSADPELPVEDMMTMEDALRRWTQPARFVALLMGSLSALAIGLASIGVYGVMACIVAQRWREIGIRVALGATSAHVRRLLMGSALRMVCAGLALGLLGAWAGTRALEGILAGTSPTDPVVFTVATLVLALAGLCAAWIPARGARLVNPTVALRAE
jgi:putative ABC transport system permease protein